MLTPVQIDKNIAAFFEFARKRHQIYLDKTAGKPFPWTDDPILNSYSFTNVFRELDKTTVWFKQHVRDPMREELEVLLATVTFRWFNRIQTGEAIFQQQSLYNGKTPWEGFAETGDPWVMYDPIKLYCGNGPYVTGAYMIKSPSDMAKLPGILQSLEWFVTEKHRFLEAADCSWLEAAEHLLTYPGKTSLEQAWNWLRRFPMMGDFMAYEVITDLRWTMLLDQAPDIMTWANPGPGCSKGLSTIYYGDREAVSQSDKRRLLPLMQDLLDSSTAPAMWPADWPRWEMRDVEHTLCEFDKYSRTKAGLGRPKGKYIHRG